MPEVRLQVERRNVRVFRDKRGGGFGRELDVTNIPCCAVLAGTVGKAMNSLPSRKNKNGRK
jgi:hypothetical protein